jgi:hypothetical protein
MQTHGFDSLPKSWTKGISKQIVQVGWQEACSVGGLGCPNFSLTLFLNSVGGYINEQQQICVTSMAAYILAKQLQEVIDHPGEKGNQLRSDVAAAFRDVSIVHKEAYVIDVEPSKLHLIQAYIAAQSLAQLTVSPTQLDAMYSDEEKQKFKSIVNIKEEMMQMLHDIASKDAHSMLAFFKTHTKKGRPAQGTLTQESRPFLLYALSFNAENKAIYRRKAGTIARKHSRLFPLMPETLSTFNTFLCSKKSTETQASDAKPVMTTQPPVSAAALLQREMSAAAPPAPEETKEAEDQDPKQDGIHQAPAS